MYIDQVTDRATNDFNKDPVAAIINIIREGKGKEWRRHRVSLAQGQIKWPPPRAQSWPIQFKIVRPSNYFMRNHKVVISLRLIRDNCSLVAHLAK